MAGQDESLRLAAEVVDKAARAKLGMKTKRRLFLLLR
jgi:hypothetical protein